MSDQRRGVRYATSEELDRAVRELRSDLEVHRKDGFAHGMLIDRLTNQAEREHDALAQRDDALDRRVGVLERFRAQVYVLSAIGFSILGALAFAVAERFVVHGTP